MEIVFMQYRFSIEKLESRNIKGVFLTVVLPLDCIVRRKKAIVDKIGRVVRWLLCVHVLYDPREN